MHIRKLLVLIAVVVVLAVPGAARAADFRAEEGSQDISGTVDDDVYVVGEAIEVSGNVTGDVVGAGQSIDLSGSVGGSLFAGAESVDIGGEVGNSARVGARELNVSGTITHDLLAGAQAITIEPEAGIGRDIVAGAQDLIIRGSVDGDVRGSVQSLTIDGTVAGDVRVTAGQVTLTEGALVEGDLIYTSADEADIDPGAEVLGEVTRRTPKTDPDEGGGAVDLVLGFVRDVAGAFALGLVLLWLLPRLLPSITGTVRSRPWPSLGIGLAALVVIPIAALPAIVLTVILGAGFSVPLLALAVWGFLAVVAKAAIGLLLGHLVLHRAAPGTDLRPPQQVASLALGVTALALVALIPILGGLVMFLATLFTMGGALVAFYHWRRAPADAQPADTAPAPSGP